MADQGDPEQIQVLGAPALPQARIMSNPPPQPEGNKTWHYLLVAFHEAKDFSKSLKQTELLALCL
jgi:hypothetical protein